MKSLLFLSLLTFNLSQASADYTKFMDLKMNCDAEAQITKTLGSTYHPEVPPKGRFPGMPAYTVYSVEIQFLAFSPACTDFIEMYDLTLPTLVKTTMSSLELGVMTLTLEQELPSVQNLLPLYPDFHSEKLSLVGKHGLKVDLPYNFQEQYDSYNLAHSKNFSEEGKLQLTKKILEASLDLYEGKNGFQKSDFSFSYSSTIFDEFLPEIKDGSVLKQQAGLYIAYLDKLYSLNPKARYFRFHVGGAGGQKIGAIISSLIKRGAIDNSTALGLVKKYPALLSLHVCPLAQSSDLVSFLSYVSAEKKSSYFYKDAVQSLTGGQYSSCGELKTPEIKDLASQILLELF